MRIEAAQAAKSAHVRTIGRALGHFQFPEADLDALAEVAAVWPEARFEVVACPATAAASVTVATPGRREVDLLPYLHAVLRNRRGCLQFLVAVPRFPAGSGLSATVTFDRDGTAVRRRMRPLPPDYPAESTSADLKAAEVIAAGKRGAAARPEACRPTAPPARPPGPGRTALTKAERQARWRQRSGVVSIEIPVDVADLLRAARQARGMTVAELLLAAVAALEATGGDDDHLGTSPGAKRRISVTSQKSG